jgi:hypothetical protein
LELWSLIGQDIVAELTIHMVAIGRRLRDRVIGGVGNKFQSDFGREPSAEEVKRMEEGSILKPRSGK